MAGRGCQACRRLCESPGPHPQPAGSCTGGHLLRLPGQKDRRWMSSPRRPMVSVVLPWMCHRRPGAEQSRQSTGEQSVWWLLAQPVFSTTCCSLTCWPNSASCDGAAEPSKPVHTYKFCDVTWLDRDFVELLSLR